LRGVEIEVPSGGMVAILGANGAGKTTTLRAICNMLVRTRGEIRFDGKPTENIVRLGIGHIPEGRSTFAGLTVEENLKLGGYTRRDNGVERDRDRVYGHFPILRERRKQQAGTLSGGEQQMLAIARALMLRPKLLLLDEPSFGLAPILVQEMFRILRTINQEDSVSMLLVEQNASLALTLVESVVLLETGRVVASGPPSRIVDDEQVRRAYLGE